MANDLNTVRKALFDTLTALRDKNDPMDIERARAVSNVAGRLLESARVELDFLRATGQQDSLGTGFVPIPSAPDADVDTPPNGILSVRKHLIR
jgi:hypothetical protein